MASSLYFSTREFNQASLLSELTDACQTGQLLPALKKHWKSFVLSVFANKLDQTKEERWTSKYLLKPLEIFLCGGDPEAVFQQLRDKETPSQLCGKVFKNGEPTYSCRDCANDPTCVLCIECFQKSEHKKHRYKMHTSGGGGYCDCGDVEAWKTDPYCENHLPGSNNQTNPLENLPDDITNRASALILAALQYAVEMLTWEQSDNLPVDLQPEEELQDTYHTMLFNDEVHTYEQVITALMRAVDCTQKQALDYASMVDREGRSIVRQGTFKECSKAKDIIQQTTSRHGSKPLKVMVMHTIVVAHQNFALKVIGWLQSVISKSDGMRRLFCLLSLQRQEDGMSITERLLLSDTQLWKFARVNFHKLLMSGILVDLEYKRQFAIIFAKWYPQMMRDYTLDDHDHDVCIASLSVQIFTVPSLHYPTLVREFLLDDHYRSVSITSKSVQIFTVPTLARMLVAEHGLLETILKTFLTACEEKKNNEGKLSFERSERNASSQTFKRAGYMLYDLKYALGGRPSPEEWTDGLKESFLQGLKEFLKLLKMMQGMGRVTRQTGQHMEYEPEWEGGFNLQLKLNEIIALFLDWCGSDKEVLIKAFKLTEEVLSECHGNHSKLEEKIVAGHKVKCIQYNVASQPIAIHLPLSRFLAGLYLYFSSQGLDFKGTEIQHPKSIAMIELMEPALRMQVLVAQNQANMWRRNGYSLQNQIFFYHNVKCRQEMFDKDVVMLQVAAVVLNPNDFIVHLLNRYGLCNWVMPEYDIPGNQDDLSRQTITLAEDFLNLLLIVISERYMPGLGKVTRQDCVKREIIHQLSMSSMTHSKLSKALPEDENHETGIDSVIHQVADFKKPPTGSTGHGKFELKKEAFSQFNPFFYHYTRSDQSKAEEAQLKRRKYANESLELPPPVPAEFDITFEAIINLLQCDVMLHIMHLLLMRTSSTRSRAWSEAQFDRILHLIGLSLHEQKRAIKQGSSGFDFLNKATSGERNILNLMESLVGNQNITHESSKDLLTWTLRLFAEVRQMKNEPVAMVAVEQLSSSTDQKSEEVRKKKARMAAKRREKIMAQMSNMQKNFIKENAELFQNTDAELSHASSDMDISESADGEWQVAIGPSQSKTTAAMPSKTMCILCQEEQEIGMNNRAMVLAAFVQRSTVLSQNRERAPYRHGEDFDPLFTPADLAVGTYTSSCGHVMHADCWQRFFDAILLREQRRPLRIRSTLSFNVDQMEFLCPLCQCISNTVIPCIPSLSTLEDNRESLTVDLSYNDWLDALQKSVYSSVHLQSKPDIETMDTGGHHHSPKAGKESTESGASHHHQSKHGLRHHHVKKANKGSTSEEESGPIFKPFPLSKLRSQISEAVCNGFKKLFHVDTDSFCIGDDIKEMMKKFNKDVYVFGLNVDPDDTDRRVPIITRNTCAFTIQAIEQQLESENKPLFGALSSRHSDCLSALVKFLAVNCRVIPSSLCQEDCVHLLSALLGVGEGLHKNKVCFVDIDLFHYLVGLVVTLPSLYIGKTTTSCSLPLGGLNELYALQLVLTAHLVQIMLTCDILPSQVSMEMENDEESERLYKIFMQIRRKASMEVNPAITAWQFQKHLRQACLPFLRCCAIFFNQLTDIMPPPSLLSKGTEEFESICSYLGLSPHLSSLFTSSSLVPSLLEKWCSDEDLQQKLCSASSEKITSYPLRINKLVDLPHDFSELINSVSTFTCPKSESDDSRAPTMCLVCGKILCSQSYCCQTDVDGVSCGAAIEHTYSCGAGTGVFLRVRDCQVFLLCGKSKGCFIPPPYLDIYGEADQGLRRGNPLTLCKESYRNIEKIWFGHHIPETVAHKLDHNNVFAFDWQMY